MVVHLNLQFQSSEAQAEADLPQSEIEVSLVLKKDRTVGFYEVMKDREN